MIEVRRISEGGSLSFEVVGSGTMDAYVADKARYIYWSTPQCRDQIRLGEGQYLWRALGEGPRGIIAVGTVAEPPRKYSPATVSQFKRPDRLEIGEEAASSGWKTGISISGVRLRAQTGMLTAEMLIAVCPTLNILRMPCKTVFRIDAEQREKIDTLWAS